MQVKTNKVAKGIIFAGCSFTWGQGLYYYSNLPSLKEPAPFCYDNTIVKDTHIRYMEMLRFPRLVANHFNTFELVHPINGGSTDVAVDWWNKSFAGNEETSFWFKPKPIDRSDVSCIVFQCTHWHRNFFDMHFQGNDYHISCTQAYEHPYSDFFTKWLVGQNLTLDKWEAQQRNTDMSKIKTFLQDAEQHGIKTVLLTYPENNIEYIKKDPWLYERFMQITYKDKTYNSMETIMKDNINLVIKSDYEYFIEPPQDGHPSLRCHEIIAENIINHLEKYDSL